MLGNNYYILWTNRFVALDIVYKPVRTRNTSKPKRFEGGRDKAEFEDEIKKPTSLVVLTYSLHFLSFPTPSNALSRLICSYTID